MYRPSAGAVLVPLVFLSFSGCFGPEGEAKAFDALPAPSWSPGFEWTYDVTSSYHSTFAERGRPITDSDTEQQTTTMRVVNDTVDLGDEPVYMVRASEAVDHPFFTGTLQAISKADLSTAGYGWDAGDRLHPPTRAPQAVSYDGVYSPYHYPSPSDPCEGVTSMLRISPESRFSPFRFPLDDGLTWSGTWANENDAPQFAFTSKSHGMVPIQVPAGAFPSVYVESEFVPLQMKGMDREMPFDFRIRAEMWYSPDVRYLTKMVVTAKASGADPGGEFGAVSFDYVSTMQLREFRLVASDAEPVEIVVEEPYDYRAKPYPAHEFRIVTDHELPVELAGGPVTVNLGLERVMDGRWQHDGRVQTRAAEAMPTSADFDHSTHELIWVVGRYGDYGGTWQEIRGDTASVTLEEGGRYGVQAHVRPIKCGADWQGFYSGDLTTTWTQTFNVPVDVGTQRTIKAGVIPLHAEPNSFTIEWSQKPTAVSRIDAGHLTLRSPQGERRELRTSPFQDQFLGPPGSWALDWNTDGPTVGDDVQILVRIVYDPWFEYPRR